MLEAMTIDKFKKDEPSPLTWHATCDYGKSTVISLQGLKNEELKKT
jgi:hypothetical protein